MSSTPTAGAAPTRADAPDAQSRGLTATLILALGTFAVGTDAFVVAGFLPQMAGSLHISESTAGQSVTVFAAAYAILSPILATVTARLPRRRLLLVGLAVLTIGNVLAAVAPNFAVLTAARIAAAAGAAMYTPNAGAVGAALVRPELRARALAVVVGGLTVATAVGIPLGTVVSQVLDWRSALGAVALLCVLSGVGVRAIMPELPGATKVPLRTRLAVLGRPGVLAVLPVTVLGMTACYTAYAYTVPTLHAVGVTAGIAWMLLLYGVGAVFGNLVAGLATDRWGALRVLSAGYVCMAVALGALGWLAGAHAVTLPLVGLLMAVWGASSWCQTPPQQHRLIAAAPGEAPLVVSLNSSGIYLGIGLGTLIGGATLPAGITVVCVIGAAIAVVALIFLLATAAAAARGAESAA
ncbi:MFS transporter [Actinokineospora enzanensis]|uniref:MFS transporter n=1 Tax=Actinokineospora enzanensis TaxID=155975 RepID=UPI0003634AFD|nr:MFS transporter [Actinokineospora enzanensis]